PKRMTATVAARTSSAKRVNLAEACGREPRGAERSSARESATGRGLPQASRPVDASRSRPLDVIIEQRRVAFGNKDNYLCLHVRERFLARRSNPLRRSPIR